jgi:hypothetical protein
MASFAALRTTVARRITPLAVRQTQRRNFALGGASGPPPEWEGIDKVVRGVFPADYQRTCLRNSGFPCGNGGNTPLLFLLLLRRIILVFFFLEHLLIL